MVGILLLQIVLGYNKNDGHEARQFGEKVTNNQKFSELKKLTKRQNLMETIRGGSPDRFVKQYEYLNQIKKGGR